MVLGKLGDHVADTAFDFHAPAAGGFVAVAVADRLVDTDVADMSVFCPMSTSIPPVLGLPKGLFGALFKENAFISGAEVGCQGEVGSGNRDEVGALTAETQPRSASGANVSQASGFPVRRPVVSHLSRCTDVPWVNWLSSTRCPPSWD